MQFPRGKDVPFPTGEKSHKAVLSSAHRVLHVLAPEFRGVCRIGLARTLVPRLAIAVGAKCEFASLIHLMVFCAAFGPLILSPDGPGSEI